MKKLVLSTFVALFAISASFAQTVETATELYNAGATELNAGNMATALENFEKALAEAEIIGFDAEEVANNCKAVIPTIYLHIGKEYGVAKNLDKAVETLKIAIEKGADFGDDNVVAEATSLIPQLFIQNGNEKLNAKDYEAAVAAYLAALDFDGNNAMAWLSLGMASSRTSNDEQTVNAFTKAAELGQKANADKQLSGFYLTKANKARQAKDFTGAMDYASKANQIEENATAHKIYAIAAISAKKNAEAVVSLEAYLAMSPNANDANQMKYYAATAYEALGQADKACGYYRAILTDPQFAEYAKHKVEVELKCK